MFERIRIAWYSRKLIDTPAVYHDYLSQYNDYYVNLNENLKKHFRKRIFIANKFISYKPVHFDRVTSEMQILITSALVQITFGLNKYILRKYKTILVVPNTYKFHKYEALLGHVDHDENLIVMSWPSVKDGFIIPDDAFNVALHEIAHALQSENFNRPLYAKFFNVVRMSDWEEEAIKKLYKIRAQRHTFIRDYAGQNLLEMFAVCIEAFFEQSQLFKERVPKLYGLLVALLRQDPTKKENPFVP